MSELDDAYQAAESLDPDERLRLVARLWKMLPADHRAALITLQLEDARNPDDRSHPHAPQTPSEPNPPDVWQFLYDRLFDRSNISGLYSAPRRFDLATIFVVTAAYSLMFGGLTAMGMPAAVKVIVGGLITVVAAAQALFLRVANPRGVSIVSGSLAQSIMLGILSLAERHAFPEPLFVVVAIYGLIGGAVCGYLAGVLVGGVFLVADALRGKFEGRVQSDTIDKSIPDANQSSNGISHAIESDRRDQNAHDKSQSF